MCEEFNTKCTEAVMMFMCGRGITHTHTHTRTHICVYPFLFSQAWQIEEVELNQSDPGNDIMVMQEYVCVCVCVRVCVCVSKA